MSSHPGKPFMSAAALILWSKVSLSPPSNQNFFLVALPSHECLKYPICQEHWLSPLYLISYWSFSGSQFKCHFPERLLSPLRKGQSPLLYSPYIFFLSGNFHTCNFASICLITWLMTFCLEIKCIQQELCLFLLQLLILVSTSSLVPGREMLRKYLLNEWISY